MQRKTAYLIIALILGIIFALVFGSSDIFGNLQLSIQESLGSGKTSTDFVNVPVASISLLIAFAVGLSMVVTPCFMPLLFTFTPTITEGKSKKDWLINLTLYSFGLIAVGIVLGAIVGFLGGTILDFINNYSQSSKNIAIIIFSLIGFAVLTLGLTEFGLFSLPSSNLQSKFQQKTINVKGHRKSLLNGLIMGGALGVGCPFPTYHAVLIWAALTGSPLLGALMLGVLGFGRIFPLIIISLLATTISTKDMVAWISKKRLAVKNANAFSLTLLGSFLISFWIFTVWLKLL